MENIESNDKSIIADNTEKLKSYTETVKKSALTESARLPEKICIWIDPETGQLCGLKREGDTDKQAEGFVSINIPMSTTQENNAFRTNLFLPISTTLFKAGLTEKAQDILSSSINRFSTQ